jgi:hypothetical protein
VVKGHPTTYIAIFDNNRPMKARKLFVDRTGEIHDELLVCDKKNVAVLDFDPQSVLPSAVRIFDEVASAGSIGEIIYRTFQ